MIITQTPFRISFFGGGTDIPAFYLEHGGAILSSTIDKYCYVNAKHLSPFFDYSTELVYSKIERVNKLSEIDHPAIRAAMEYLNMRNLRLTYEADLPARSGLGTSSSFAVGMLNAFYALKGKYANKRRLADDAIYLERTLCNEAGGMQDQIAAAFGGLNKITFGQHGYLVEPIVISQQRKKDLNDRLMLFFSGFSRFSAQIQKHTVQAIPKKRDQLIEMAKLVEDAKKILTSKAPLSEFGQLLDWTWKLKRGITDMISDSHIDDIYQSALRAGALGGKLLGAGGGGFILFYVDLENQKRVRDSLSQLMYVPFRFENRGANIIYFEPEELPS